MKRLLDSDGTQDQGDQGRCQGTARLVVLWCPVRPFLIAGSCQGQERRCQGKGRQEGRPAGNQGAGQAQDPHIRHLPPVCNSISIFN